MLNPLRVVRAVVRRFIPWTAPKPQPRPDPDGSQGLEVPPAI
jgi:hypothetical protein